MISIDRQINIAYCVPVGMTAELNALLRHTHSCKLSHIVKIHPTHTHTVKKPFIVKASLNWHMDVAAMLILSRKAGETLNIGDEVTVTVLSVKGNQVRIGINAPKEIAVHREEIYNRIARENERAPQDLVAAIS